MSNDHEPHDRKLAQRLFGHLRPEELPSAEQVLRALEVRKGIKFQINPEKLDALRTRQETDGGFLPPVCVMCDESDICKRCDTIDCFPNHGDLD